LAIIVVKQPHLTQSPQSCQISALRKRLTFIKSDNAGR
jgi:hypothetical protein